MDTITKSRKPMAIAIFVLTLLFSTLICRANGRWHIYAGGSISHMCETYYEGLSKLNYGWGGGAFIGGGYEINFTPHWSLSPQFELAYNDNGAHRDNKIIWNYEWREFLTVNIPVIASFRFLLSDKVGLRVGAGPYLQEALYGRKYRYGTDIKEKMSGSIARRLNVGIMGEAAVETGKHLSYMFRVQYPFLKEGWIRKTVVLSVGIGYAF